MIQPIKQFRVTRLTISGFKGYADQKTFQFGGMNVISGHMGVGKSSIADAIAFAITGVGFYAGAKIDYLYHQDTRDLLVELEFEDESGKLRTLARHRKDDKMDITLDGVRIGQGDLTTMFGERDLFLSMFNPQYFINVLGSKGRNLLERYLPEVPKAEVLAQLSDQTRALLEKQEFLSAEAYSKQLREQVTDIEKDMVYIQGQIDLHASQQKEQAQELMEAQVRHTQLQERIGELERKRTTGFDGNSMIDRLADLYARYEELQRENPVIADTATWIFKFTPQLRSWPAARRTPTRASMPPHWPRRRSVSTGSVWSSSEPSISTTPDGGGAVPHVPPDHHGADIAAGEGGICRLPAPHPGRRLPAHRPVQRSPGVGRQGADRF